MTTTKIHGYVVVDTAVSGSGYRGFERESWDVVEADFYDNKLPRELADLYLTVSSSELHGNFFPRVAQKEIALRFMEYSKKAGRQVELIALYSTYLDQFRPTVEVPEPDLRFLGYDASQIGGWSLMAALVFAEPVRTEFLALFENEVNESMLLKSQNSLPRLEAYYRQLTSANRVESLGKVDAENPVCLTEVYLCQDFD